MFGSDNGMLPLQHQAIIYTSASFLLIAPLQQISFTKIHLKILFV